MALQITADQITKMAPDAASASAGRKLSDHKHWTTLGQSSQVLWGTCQGSALYKVCIDTSSFTVQCTCPSRKQPCKHGLGLLFLIANASTSIADEEAPDWVVAWLNRRAAASQRKESAATARASKVPSASQIKQAEKRQEKVLQGVEQLDLWLNDLVRTGLGSLESQSSAFWERQAAQLVDAQAPGLATQVRSMAAIPNASANWSEKLLARLGKLTLLSEAYQHIERLEAAAQEDVRQLVGWSLKEPEVRERGERVVDDWLMLGQVTEDIERGRARRTWLFGQHSSRSALLLQFSFAGSDFAETYAIGSHQQAELAYWPGKDPQRALPIGFQGEIMPIQERLPGAEGFQTFLATVAEQLANCTWRERFLCIMRDVIPIYDMEARSWYLRDQTGRALPLNKGEHWQLLALTGGSPVDCACEWDGESLLPLSVLVDGALFII